MRAAFFCTLVLLLGCASVDARDKDKKRLFNTFFMEGNRVTYVITLEQSRRYTLWAPDGSSITRTYVASDKEIGFPLPNGGLRHFEYDFDGLDVKLKPTKKDRPQAGHIVGAMPPIGRDSKVVLVAIQNWRERGLPTQPNTPPVTVAQKPPAANPPQPRPPVVRPPNPPAVKPVTPIPVPPPVSPPTAVNPPKPVPPVQTGPKDITGTYTLNDDKGRPATLRLREGGTFDYAAPDGRRAGGTHLYLNGELNLDSGFWRRHFHVAKASNGLRFSRRKTDVPKLGDPLGEMAPAEGNAVWAKKADSTAVTKAGPVTPVEPPPGTSKPVTSLPPPEPVVKKPTPPSPVAPPKPVQPQPGTAPEGLAGMAGTYMHQPNPLVSETWVLAKDGTFEYRDSNGAKVNGAVTLKDGVVRLQAGEVVRHFSVAIEKDGTLTFSRTENDAPRILNDLASMSPSVLKSAKYQKK